MQNRWTWLMAALLVAGCEQKGNVGSNDDLGPADSAPTDLGLDRAATDAKASTGWVVTLGGNTDDDAVWRVANDSSGNLVVLASVTGEVTLEGKTGEITLTPATTGMRTVIAKLEKATQKWVWAVELDGSPQDNMSGFDGLAVDASDNIYYAGRFTGTATFGATTLTSAGGLDIFVVKLGPDGQVKWAVRAGGPGEDDADAVAVGDDGKLVVVGLFSATATFDSQSLVASGKNDLFVARLDADNGAFDWAVGAGSDTTDVVYEWAQSVVIDDAGNSYVGGGVGGGAVFGESVIAGDVDKVTAYVAKVAPSGKFVWAKRIWATDTRGLALDASGYVYLVAGLKIADLPDPGYAAYSNALLVARGDSAGSFWTSPETWLSYLTCGGVLDPAPQILVDGQGNSTVAGWFMGVLDIGSVQLSAVDTSRRGFVAWLDPSGHYTNAVQIKGGMSMVWHLARDTTGGLYAAGAFRNTGDFNGITATSSGSTENGFIWYIPGLE